MIPTKPYVYRDSFIVALAEAMFSAPSKRRDPKQRGEYKKAKRRAQNAKMRKHQKRMGQR